MHPHHPYPELAKLAVLPVAIAVLGCGSEGTVLDLTRPGDQQGAFDTAESRGGTGDSGGGANDAGATTDAAPDAPISGTGKQGSGVEIAVAAFEPGPADPSAAPECQDDPRCTAAPTGVFCLGHLKTFCEDSDGNGCLDFWQENCAPGVCEVSSVSCIEGGSGEACGDAIQVLHSGFVLSGEDFNATFSDDLELTGNGCGLADQGAPDAVLQLSLAAGQTLSVNQTGPLDSIIHLQGACGAAQDCLDTKDEPEGVPLTYTAPTDETVFVIVESYLAAPELASFLIRVDIDPECGNGLIEAAEECDDGGTVAADGCSSTCTAEPGYTCTQTSPSLCALYPTLGEFGVGDSIDRIEWEQRMEWGEHHVYRVSFRDRLLLDIETWTRTTGNGDVNVDLKNELGVLDGGLGWRTGDEHLTGIGIEPGEYFLDIWAKTPLPNGYAAELTIRDPGVCGDGALVPAFEECDPEPGSSGCSNCKVDFDHTCTTSSPSECNAITDLGEHAAADPIADIVVTEPITNAGSDYRIIHFTEDVLLSWTLSVNGEVGDGIVELIPFPEKETPYLWDGPDLVTDLPVAAGTYKLRILAYRALENGYTLSLSTRAP